MLLAYFNENKNCDWLQPSFDFHTWQGPEARMENSEKEHVEPGAARFGNFPDYYRFNPADERMKYLAGISKSSLPFITGSKSVECIDIGCNTGVSQLVRFFFFLLA